MKIILLDAAIRDLRSGKEFYEKQELGIGNYFEECLFSDIDSLMLFGGVHPKRFGFYWLLSKRFPYAIYYKMDDNSVIRVCRVLDCRRDPAVLRGRLRD